jgi:kinesin family member 2/24
MVLGAEMVPKGKENDDVKYVCAVVHLAADVNAAYEFLWARQMVLEGKNLREVLKLEYDIHTRYYLVNGD